MADVLAWEATADEVRELAVHALKQSICGEGGDVIEAGDCGPVSPEDGLTVRV